MLEYIEHPIVCNNRKCLAHVIERNACTRSIFTCNALCEPAIQSERVVHEGAATNEPPLVYVNCLPSNLA
eukprot:7406282-Pyramimonas_sp.AAC.1